MIVLDKGLTGRYVPLAITLISEKLFSAFNDSVAEGKALVYGHSYRGKALGCAAAKDVALVHHNRSANQSCGNPPRVYQQGLAVQ